MAASQFQRHCIFCGGEGLSKEHFYSDWMRDLVREDNPSTYEVGLTESHPKTGTSLDTLSKRPGSLTSKKFRVVCRACNHGWMNRLEADARPLLTSLIRDEQFELDQAKQQILARWISTKVITAENANPAKAVTPPNDRRALMAQGTIPAYFRIYLCRHGLKSKTGFVRLSNSIGKIESVPVPPLDGFPKNVQQVTFVLGSALVHVNAARIDNWSIENALSIPIVHEKMRLWPSAVETLVWPRGPRLSGDDVRMLAWSLRKLTNHPHAMWIDY